MLGVAPNFFHVPLSRGLRHLRQCKEIGMSPRSNNEAVRNIVDELLKPTPFCRRVYVRLMEKSTVMNSKNEILVGDPKVVQNRVVALRADIANKWNENGMKNKRTKIY